MNEGVSVCANRDSAATHSSSPHLFSHREPVWVQLVPVHVQSRSSPGPVQVQVYSAPQPLVADMKLLLLLLLIERAAAQQRGEKLSLHSLMLICFCRGQSSDGFCRVLLVELYEVWLVLSHEEKDSSLTCFWWKQLEQKLNLFGRSVFYLKFVMIELFYFNVPAVFSWMSMNSWSMRTNLVFSFSKTNLRYYCLLQT